MGDDALLNWDIDPFPRVSDDDEDDCDDYAGCMPDDREPPPDFGCACQNPIVVDSVCYGCMVEMARQNAEADRERAAASARELARLEASPQGTPGKEGV